MNKKDNLYIFLMMITIAVLYIGMTALNATVFWSMNDNLKRGQQFVAMILSGVGGYFIWKPIIRKKFRGSDLRFDGVMILAIIVANIFRATVSEFSLGYISLMMATLYLVAKD